MLNDLMIFNEEVEQALHENKPIVVLESTIISHGMPYPDNITTALCVENIIRELGVIPATIALHNGKIRVGITSDIMNILGQSTDIVKASKRDLAFVLSQKQTASTTVAATMFAAH